MNDFQNALATLQANDLSFFAPRTVPPTPRKRRNKAGSSVAKSAIAVQADPSTALDGERPSDNNTLPKIVMIDADTASAGSAPRTRQHIEHTWPPIGAVLAGTYFGVTYRAEVVAANKTLKSGRQLKLLDGPAQGQRLDSFTQALLVATERQRRESCLGRQRVSNGWDFWKPETTVSPAATKCSKESGASAPRRRGRTTPNRRTGLPPPVQTSKG
jgi:hypothetical protein